MKRYIIPALTILNISLAGGLALQWVTRQGTLRNVHWVAPAPIKPVLPGLVMPSWSADLGSFMAALDRPLFAATRKPPPKAEAAPAVVVDTLAEVRVLGLYSSGGTLGGAIVRSAGKVLRVRPGDPLAGWTVKEIRPQELVLIRGDETRALNVKRGPELGADGSGQNSASTGGASFASSKEPDLYKRQQMEASEQTARVNELRARAGFPPVP